MERILIVDDDKFMRSSLQTELEAEGFQVTTAENGMKAIELAREQHFDLVLCDVRMPDIDGIETIAAIKEVQPVARSIVITAYASPDKPISALKLRVDDYLMKPFSIDDLLKSVRSTLIRLKQSASSGEGVARYRRNFLRIITGILFESRVSYLVGHSERVARLSLQIGRGLGLSPGQVQNLYIAALLHDMGYIDLPPHLMDKKEFKEQDFEHIKGHPMLARDLLSPFREMKEIATIILYHHERWDGKGYPQGLKGEQIPIESRIIALAEAYDSLVSERPHRAGISVQEALKTLNRDSGTCFDPRISALLPSILDLYGGDESPLPPPLPEEQENRISLLLNLADIYREHGNLDIASDAYAKALDYLPQGGSPELRIRLKMGIVQILADRECYDEALAKAGELQRYARENSLAFMDAQISLQAACIRMKRGSLKTVEEELRAAREIFVVWESSYHQCEADFLLSCFYASGGEALSAPFAAHFAKWLGVTLEGHYFDIMGRYRDLSSLLIRRALQDSLLLEDLALLFKDPQRAPLSILAHLMDDPDGGLRLKVLDILKGLKDRAAQALIAKAQIDPDRAVAEKSTMLVRSLPEAASTTLLQIFFFGKFRVMVGDTLLDDEAWITRKARSLFAYLASRHGEEESEEKLMDIFWLQGGGKALHSLHNCITVIRKIFAPSLGQSAKKIIVNRKAGYLFNRKIGCFIDLEAFNDSFHQGRSLFEEDQWQEGLSELQKAERLYTGDFMEGSYDEWSDDLRLSMRNRFIELMALLGTYFFRKNKYEVSLDYWKKLVARDNCYEQAYLGLMLCHSAMDNKNEAIRVYHQCAQTLKHELDLPPPADVAEVYLKLIEGKNVPLIL
jgi:putative two-component system response regulator